ncbi:MAG: proline iminopeptidase-family hydrolase [Candidatus Saganbacteria bacterium]|nr:proline iminopeptidase-family hydrolase [Candidatus Saganbacteria bacterium]
MKNTRTTQEAYIPVTGGKVWYKIVDANKKRIPLLVLHGGPGAPHDCLEPIEALADNRPVIFYDQQGCGNSGKPEDPSFFTIESFINELEQVRKALNLKKVHILGQSWGSMLAVDYILNRKPKGVVSLILSGPCLSVSRWSKDQKAYLAELPEKLQKVIKESEASGDFTSQEYQDAMMYYYKLHICRLDPWPDCLNRTFEKLGKKVYEHMWGPSEFTITGTLKKYERASRLKEIKIPVLFTCGRYDEASPGTTEYYHKMLPGSEVVVFEEASHAHHIEKTDQYLETVRDFLHSCEARDRSQGLDG